MNVYDNIGLLSWSCHGARLSLVNKPCSECMKNYSVNYSVDPITIIVRIYGMQNQEFPLLFAYIAMLLHNKRKQIMVNSCLDLIKVKAVALKWFCCVVDVLTHLPSFFFLESVIDFVKFVSLFSTTV